MARIKKTVRKALGMNTTSDLFSKAAGRNVTEEPSFSFIYDGKPSQSMLNTWERSDETVRIDECATKTLTTFFDKRTALRVTCESVRYHDFQAVDWVLFFENCGKEDTPLIENVQALDFVFWKAIAEKRCFDVHQMSGTINDPSEFAMRILNLSRGHVLTLCAKEGILNRGNLPFLKLDTGAGSVIMAVGWSGQWKVQFRVDDNGRLIVQAGLEKTHFILHPGERVRSPRILMTTSDNHGLKINNEFRRLILKHYVPKFQGNEVQPFLYCNSGGITGFNESNAKNQVSLIRALRGLGLEVFLTDAGWFEGGWGDGLGNWTLKKDAYPNGIAPVSAAAKEAGMLYGFWFEPERAIEGTEIYCEHPEWLISKKEPSSAMKIYPKKMALLKMWLPEVREYLVNRISEFMKVPGFKAYRQDFNETFSFHPDYLKCNDAEDRQGITEMKYVEGLYDYWDMLAQKFPDSYRENCWRYDIESIKRFHVQQKSDSIYDPIGDQTANFHLSHYLPNAIFSTCYKSMSGNINDYSFHSAMASSLCVCWPADEKNFPRDRAKELASLFLEVRPLLNGDWYPLTGDPASLSLTCWMGSQFHRPDLEKGFLLIYKREFAREETTSLKLQALDANAKYRVTFKRTGITQEARGSELMNGLEISIPETPGSRVILYQKVDGK